MEQLSETGSPSNNDVSPKQTTSIVISKNNNYCTHHISVISSSHHYSKKHCYQRNLNNLIQINIDNAAKSSCAVSHCVKKTALPNISLLNARSLLPKLDELSASLSFNPVDIIAVTETWFNEDIEDNLVSIYGYNLFRKDRPNRRGGGVCIYLSELFYAKRRTDLERDDFECLWLWLRPTRLPRPLSGIAVCVIYHPPGLPEQEHYLLNEYLINSADILRNQYPNCGLIFLGDFNDFQTSSLLSRHSLKQLVLTPTRGSAILDLIITNLSDFYEAPQVLAPLGSSDHNIVMISPNLTKSNHTPHRKPIKRLVQLYPRSSIDAFGRWATTNAWFSELDSSATVDDLTTSFTSQLVRAIDRIFPTKLVKCHPSDKPWITPAIKTLIRDRQKAFHSCNIPLWLSLRRKVQEKIVQRKKSFYKNKVQHLMNTDSPTWWRTINKMSGKSNKSKSFSLERNGEKLNDEQLATTLNEFYASVNADIPTLNLTSLPAFLPTIDNTLAVQSYEVCHKLLALKPHKATGPDNVPSRILESFAHVLAEPITIIFNASLSSSVVPKIWKESNIIPIPKVQQPSNEGDTRPISLTSCLSKVLEDFVVSWLIDDIKGKIDPYQFGCLKGTSTTYCLLDMIHSWLSHMDSSSNGKHIRVIFLDFSKAFDRIGHTFLIEKLLDLGVRRSLIPWIINFLCKRKQRVKIGETLSNWLPVTAGVPQGTKLGPILFLIMVNDLRVNTPDTKMWKFVDDVSSSENLTSNSLSATQQTLDAINSWVSNNWMKLNAKKCKELRICFLKETPQLSPLTIDGHKLETIRSHKVLGLIMQNNLKWDEQIHSIVTKASKRLYALRVLSRGGVPPADLIKVYTALIRSILEYCCEVWNHAIPYYLSEELEKVQKRAMRIIFPGHSYDEALQLANCTRLSDRRNKICIKTLQKIVKSGGPLAEHVTESRACAQQHKIRNLNHLSLYKCRTERFKNSFFPKTIVELNNTM